MTTPPALLTIPDSVPEEMNVTSPVDRLGDSKEESALKRRRSSESLPSLPSDQLRSLVQTEMNKVLIAEVAPALMNQMDLRFAGIQDMNKDLVSTANMVLGQVKESFEQLRHEQQQTSYRVSEENKRLTAQNIKFGRLHAEQLRNAELLAEDRRRNAQQEVKLEQMNSQQTIHHRDLQQSQRDTRFGFQVLEQAVTNHEERMLRRDSRLDPSSSSTTTPLRVQYGQDDRGLGIPPINMSAQNTANGLTYPTAQRLNTGSYAYTSQGNNVEYENRSSSEFRIPTIHPEVIPVSPDPVNGAAMVSPSPTFATWPHGVKVSPPPLLDTNRYVAWKKEFLFWRIVRFPS